MPHAVPAPDSPAAPASPDAVAAACANCEAALAGDFCHRCGQAAAPPPATLRGFLVRMAADVSNLDARWLRSTGLLLTRPGRLTAEYLAGRRVCHTQPLQLYLGAAAAFFFVNAYHPFLSLDPRTGQLTSALNGVGVGGVLGDAAPARLAARGVSPELFYERFQAAVTGYLPAFLVASVLLFAGALALFHRRAPGGALAHGVFALHWSAFYLLLMIVDRLLPAAGPGRDIAGVALAVVAVGYLALALRRVYGEGWVRTGAKAVGLYAVYQLLLSLWMLSAIALAFTLLL